jgi:hypothetical protein
MFKVLQTNACRYACPYCFTTLNSSPRASNLAPPRNGGHRSAFTGQLLPITSTQALHLVRVRSATVPVLPAKNFCPYCAFPVFTIDNVLLSPKNSYPSIFQSLRKSCRPVIDSVEDLPTLIWLSVQGRLYVTPPTTHDHRRTCDDFGTSQRGRN